MHLDTSTDDDDDNDPVITLCDAAQEFLDFYRCANGREQKKTKKSN